MNIKSLVENVNNLPKHIPPKNCITRQSAFDMNRPILVAVFYKINNNNN